MIVIENVVPPQATPTPPSALVASAANPPGAQILQVDVPDRIPPECVTSSATTYGINPFVLLAILKVESNARTGVIGKNTDGSEDLGPGQFNTRSWAKVLIEKYKIPREALLHDMCQAVRALGFAVRTEIDAARGDLWEGIGNYHSRTPVHHKKYIRLVYGAYSAMTTKGKF